MNAFPMAGMVSCYPAAHLAYFYNSNSIWHSVKSGKIISDDDINIFEKGHGHPVDVGLYSRKGLKRKYSWREKHYYIQKSNCTALLGAVHALATFRKEITGNFNTQKVDYVFKNGYEHEYIDYSIEKHGYLRLSTPKLYAYHLGNTIPKEILSLHSEEINKKNDFSNKFIVNEKYNRKNKIYSSIFPFTKILFRALRKFEII